jgi:MFS family permease
MSIFESLRVILSSKQTWVNAFYAGFLYAPAAVIGEAIGPAYLQYGRALPVHAAAFATGLIFIGWVFGGPLSGWLSDGIGRRKPIMIVSAMCGLSIMLTLVYYPNLNTSLVYVLLFLFGFTNAGVAIAYAVSTELHERIVVGTAIAFTNMVSIFVGASLQPIVGRMIDYVAGPRGYNVESLLLTDFQFGLRLLPLCSFMALVLAFMVKETYCHPLKK